MSWIEKHLEEFVKPKLGFIPNIDYNNQWIKHFGRINLAGLHALWIQAKRKAGDSPILLPGRDVFLFEVLAKMEGFENTICRPDISSNTSAYFYMAYPELKPVFEKTFCIDTGYRGSVPMKLGVSKWMLIAATSVSPATERPKRQLFGTCKKGPCISLAGTLESVPKYWDTAMWDEVNKKIIQKVVNHPDTFENAAILTRYIAESCKPKSKLASQVRGVL